VQDANIDTLIRGSVRIGHGGPLPGQERICIERRVIGPHRRGEETLAFNYLILWQGKPVVVDRGYRKGRLTRLIKQPGTLSLGAAGLLPRVEAHTAYDVLACIISPGLLERIALEEDRRPNARIHEHLGLKDDALSYLLQIVHQQAQDNYSMGKLYLDCLVQALIMRFIAVGGARPTVLPSVGGLPPHILKRIVEKIMAEFGTNLSLAELACEAGYSPSHFTKMFRLSTGQGPHAFLREVRLEYVRKQLSKGQRGVAELAGIAGFSSPSHLAAAFRQRFGVTPVEYKKLKRYL